MKKTFKTFLSIALILILFASTMIPAFAGSKPSAEELQKSIVYIEHSVKCSSKNFNGLTFNFTSSGTGFAMGIPGKPVQYIASANHVTDPKFNEGIYKVTLDSTGSRILDVEMVNLKYPQSAQDKNGNYVLVDYFYCSTNSLYAYYSVSTDDKVSLKVVEHDFDKDVSISKIGSEPTEKITARPIRTRETVETGEDITIIGYPSTTEYVDSEKRFDYSDSSVTKGSIQKTAQLTASLLNDSVSLYLYTIDATVNHGNSGGPLFDAKGNVLGICSFSFDDAENNASAHYFTAIDEMINLMNSSKIPYVVAGERNYTLIIIFAAVLVLVIAALVVLLAMRNKKKQNVVPAANYNGSIDAGLNTSAPGALGETMPFRETKKMYLLGIKGYFAGKKFSIDNRVVIGRDASRCNVVFPSEQPGVSGIHCEILINGDTLSLKDCGSTYGTYLSDGNKLPPNLPTVLRSGAQFWVGDKENVFEVRY